MATIKLDGYGEFELPESFKLREMRIIERYSEGHMEGFELSKICGVIHVAIARAKPEVSFDEIRAVVDDIDADQLDEIMGQAQAGQSPPSASENESSSNANGASSSDDSEPSSDAIPESETPPSTGSPDLAGFQSFHSMSGN